MKTKAKKLAIHSLHPIILIALVGLASLFVWVWDVEHAAAYYDSVSIKCNTNPVTEGNSFRLYIESNQPALEVKETFKVYWTTSNGSADESDYTPLDNVGQASNASQTRDGRMGRTFHTTEDDYPEPLGGLLGGSSQRIGR